MARELGVRFQAPEPAVLSSTLLTLSSLVYRRLTEVSRAGGAAPHSAYKMQEQSFLAAVRSKVCSSVQLLGVWH